MLIHSKYIINHFLMNSLMKEFCQKRNISMLLETHASLINTNKIRFLLHKHRMLIYSCEQNIETVRIWAVIKEENMNHEKANNILTIHYKNICNTFLIHSSICSQNSCQRRLHHVDLFLQKTSWDFFDSWCDRGRYDI